MRLSQSQGLIALARDDLAAGRATRRATARLELPGSGQGSVVRETGSVKTIKHSLSNR
jgi:hypothetical protein